MNSANCDQKVFATLDVVGVVVDVDLYTNGAKCVQNCAGIAGKVQCNSAETYNSEPVIFKDRHIPTVQPFE